MKKLIYLFVLSTVFLSCIHIQAQRIDLDEQVILLHGYGRSGSAMKKMKYRFEKSGYQVHLVEYSSFTQSMHDIEEEITEEIDQLMSIYSKKTHFVGHSLGGLLVRSYLGKHKLKHLGRVVLLGSPNKGTPVVDYLSKKWWFRLIGSAAKSLSSKGSKFLTNLPKPDYSLGVIAGLSKKQFIGNQVLHGKHDGLVPLESTKVEGMQDFYVAKTNHTALRYDANVFRKTLHFLRYGRF